MAEQVMASTGSAMDYEYHEKTYDRFLSLLILGIIHVVTIVLIVAIFGLGGALWLGSIALALTLGTLFYGLFRQSRWGPSAVVLGITFVFFLFAVA
ncbi:aa3-type cytochrome c oxidase subunit IV [Afifella sp. H1R]|uniref:aa3-type cytochrome c oxidase subunit IV n=1 Tax=Afifella sp. H1R TaxID=2908841 RepID=UPI001F3A4EFF|nr:aa3-type cytochrome c oxidase subunit IV [Afifella sp. H1R]MCF1504052.1 aa3-type cytochrome c oxidase subunit IV [Afifella sp. H1R]